MRLPAKNACALPILTALVTERHLTFFEMLGNFSFGDYFKKEAIAWAWEYLTKVLGLPADKLYVSIYKGGIAPRDEEAYKIWEQFVPKDHIFELGEADNFWTMGPTGPCGPCSEIYYDFGDRGCKNPHCDITCDCGRFVEIWNIVFESYNRQEDGTLAALPHNNIDTGMGLERLCMAMQNAKNVFETDLFTPLTTKAKADLKIKGTSREEVAALRIIADHARSSSFLIAEGILPSNEGRGYILRRLIRRAVRYAKLMGNDKPYLYTLVPVVQQIFAGLYPEIDKNAAHIQDVLKQEEKAFLKTLVTGEEKLAELLASGTKVLSGENAFHLHETYGFPLELTKEIALAKGVTIDEEGYKKAKQAAQDKSRSYADEFSKGKVIVMQKLENSLPATQFVGYETLTQNANVLALLNEQFETVEKLNGSGFAVFDTTPFYAESGGQVGDRGIILQGGNEIAQVNDVQKPLGKIFLHYVEGSLKVGQAVTLQVNADLRKRCMANHSAIHLINAALRQVFGPTVHQSGSYVSPQRFRFDYTLSKTPKAEELERAWTIANKAAQDALPVTCQTRPLADADKLGAVTLLGETYADPARFVLMGGSFEHPENKYSLELCAGTHVKNTADVITVMVLKEGSVSAGVRRIEGVAGYAALDYLKEVNTQAEALAARLVVPAKDVFVRVNTIMDELKDVKKRYEDFRQKTLAAGGVNEMSLTLKNGTTVILRKADDAQPKELRNIADTLAQKQKQALVIVTCDHEGKRAFVVKMAGKLPHTDAVTFAKQLAEGINGRAGGRPDFAQGGGEAKEPMEKLLGALTA